MVGTLFGRNHHPLGSGTLQSTGSGEDTDPWPLHSQLDRLVPERIEVPSGSRIRIDYSVEGPPVLAAKLQELFGWQQGPRLIDGRLPLVIHLLSPAGRPLAVTQDLESFWDSVYPEVCKEMRGRYPKHPWPDDPWKAPATARTKKRLAREKVK